MLIGRQRELQALRTFFQGESRLKIVRVEGQPGIGKTALCKEFLRDKTSICIWDPSPTDGRKNLLKAALTMESFARKVDDKLPSILIPKEGFKTWGRFFSVLCSYATASSERIVLCLDNYANLCEADPSFAPAFYDAVDVLWGCHVFALITGTHGELSSCATPARLDSRLATCTNAITLHGIGYHAAELGNPASAAEFIGIYAKNGGIPGSYANSPKNVEETADEGHFPAGGTAQAEADTMSAASNSTGLFNKLLNAPNPFVGMTSEQMAQELGIGALEAKRLAKNLKQIDLIETQPCWSFSAPEVAEGGTDQKVIGPRAEYFRIANVASICAAKPTMPNRDKRVLLDMGREWLWEALRNGDFPFEFESVGYWLPENGDVLKPMGVLGVNGHYHRAVACNCLEPGTELTRDAIDALLEQASKLPFKNPHTAILVCEPVSNDVLTYADEQRALTVARLNERGFETLANPWKRYSQRYKDAMAAKLAREEQAAIG